MISFENVTKKFGIHTVLDSINLSIGGKDFVTIVGPSGAGKTTLINMLIGKDRPTEGRILIDGYEITSLNHEVRQYYRRKLGIIFQDFQLLPKKTVSENVAFAMEACEYSRVEIRQRVPEVLMKVNLLSKQDSFPDQLSGGEKQRVAIARALVHNPKLIIADEPTGNLDPVSTKEIIKILLQLNNEGATIILATHDREMVDYIRKRVIALDQGRLVADKENSGYDVSAEIELEVENTEIEDVETVVGDIIYEDDDLVTHLHIE